MTGPLLAEFRDPETLHHAVGQVKQARHRALDAFTPYPVEGLAEDLGLGTSSIRIAMLAGGLIVAAFAFGLQWYSAVIDYPINSGGRPLEFLAGVLAGAVRSWRVRRGPLRCHRPVVVVRPAAPAPSAV